METEEPFKPEGDSVAVGEYYTVIDTLIEVEAEVLVYAQGYTFPHLQARSVTDTLTHY